MKTEDISSAFEFSTNERKTICKMLKFVYNRQSLPRPEIEQLHLAGEKDSVTISATDGHRACTFITDAHPSAPFSLGIDRSTFPLLKTILLHNIRKPLHPVESELLILPQNDNKQLLFSIAGIDLTIPCAINPFPGLQKAIEAVEKSERTHTGIYNTDFLNLSLDINPLRALSMEFTHHKQGLIALSQDKKLKVVVMATRY